MDNRLQHELLQFIVTFHCINMLKIAENIDFAESKFTYSIGTCESEIFVQIESRIKSAATIKIRIESRIESGCSHLRVQ